jgi:hypothetical protein
MQRQTLVPLKEFMAERAASGRSTRVLEVAGGTGRFATFLKVLPPVPLPFRAGAFPLPSQAQAQAGSAPHKGLRSSANE